MRYCSNRGCDVYSVEVAGEAEVLLAGETEWKKVVASDNFIAIADNEYKIRTNDILEYLCDYDEK